MPDPAALPLYQELLARHEGMRELAEAGDFAGLPALQSEIATLIARLRTLPDRPLAVADRQQLARLIQDIQAHQAAIQEAIGDWQRDVEPLLATWSRPARTASGA